MQNILATQKFNSHSHFSSSRFEKGGDDQALRFPRHLLSECVALSIIFEASESKQACNSKFLLFRLFESFNASLLLFMQLTTLCWPKITKYASDSSRVEGYSLKTWKFISAKQKNRRNLRIQVDCMTDGRPLDALVELWQGPDRVPQKIRVYSEDGRLRPFSTIFQTPQKEFTLATKNDASLEFPFGVTIADAQSVVEEYMRPDVQDVARIIQGGALRTYKFPKTSNRVKVILQTSGLPLCARIEVSQGPNNQKQVIDLFSEDGKQYPASLSIETPGEMNVIRIMNGGPMEYPLFAWVESYTKNRNRNRDMEFENVPIQQRLLRNNASPSIPKVRVPTINDSKYFPTW